MVGDTLFCWHGELAAGELPSVCGCWATYGKSTGFGAMPTWCELKVLWILVAWPRALVSSSVKWG